LAGPGFSVADIQDAGVDLLSGANEVFVPRLIAGSCVAFVLPGCAAADRSCELGARNRHGCSTKEAAAMPVDFF